MYVAKIQSLRETKPGKGGSHMRWLAEIFHEEPTTTWSLLCRGFAA